MKRRRVFIRSFSFSILLLYAVGLLWPLGALADDGNGYRPPPQVRTNRVQEQQAQVRDHAYTTYNTETPRTIKTTDHALAVSKTTTSGVKGTLKVLNAKTPGEAAMALTFSSIDVSTSQASKRSDEWGPRAKILGKVAKTTNDAIDILKKGQRYWNVVQPLKDTKDAGGAGTVLADSFASRITTFVREGGKGTAQAFKDALSGSIVQDATKTGFWTAKETTLATTMEKSAQVFSTSKVGQFVNKTATGLAKVVGSVSKTIRLPEGIAQPLTTVVKAIPNKLGDSVTKVAKVFAPISKGLAVAGRVFGVVGGVLSIGSAVLDIRKTLKDPKDPTHGDGLAKGISIFGSGLSMLGGALNIVGSVLDATPLAPLGLVLNGVGFGLTITGTLVHDNAKKLANVTRTVGNWIGETAQKTAQAVAGSALVKGIANTGRALAAATVTSAVAVGAGLIGAGRAVTSAGVQVVGSVGKAAWTAVSASASAVASVASGTAKAVGSVVQAGRTAVSTLGSIVSTGVTTLAKAITSPSTAVATLKSGAQQMAAQASAGLRAVSEQLSSAGKAITNGLQGASQAIVSGTRQIGQSATQAVQAVKTGVLNAIESVSTRVQPVRQSLSELSSTFKASVANVAQSAASSVRSVTQTVATNVKSVTQTVTNSAKSFLSSVRSVFTPKPAPTPAPPPPPPPPARPTVDDDMPVMNRRIAIQMAKAASSVDDTPVVNHRISRRNQFAD